MSQKTDENPLNLPELDFSQPLMTANGYVLKHRPDLFVVESETGRHSVLDRYGRTTVNQIRRAFPAGTDREERQEAAMQKYQGMTIAEWRLVKEEKRLAKKKANEEKARIAEAVEGDRMKALVKVLARLPNGMELGFNKAASQIAKLTGDTRAAAFWWLIRAAKNPGHPARAYLMDADTDYAALVGTGKAKADNPA